MKKEFKLLCDNYGSSCEGCQYDTVKGSMYDCYTAWLEEELEKRQSAIENFLEDGKQSILEVFLK
jgi:hypothetical protein